MLLFQPLLWEEWDSNDCLFPFRLSRLALGRKIAAYSGGSNLERNCCKIWKIYSTNRSKMAFTTKSGHDSQGNEKIYFLAFFCHFCSLNRVSSNANYWTIWKPTNLNWQRMKCKRFSDWTKIWGKLFQSTNWRMDPLFCAMEKVVIFHFITKKKCE